ncbi:Ovule protein [Caenorhabditis elegans]|uniref:Ovule protein n=1 Tax=Caenorhabditis elegans TaxID=6239 RepID=O45235_CAEEL|nr:Ovule protein [Caenorhabditis elegans]CAB03814.1 Ovule protein [Caenorhabditis elegans]|eukprot:NP_497030.1 Uncharacterized protein CELE_C01G12.3 [Caenorhabditis elegans]
MGDENYVGSKTIDKMSTSSSIENVERKMILLKIAENEKSQFDDVITGAESDNGWEDCWKETEDSVTKTIVDDVEIPDEWVDDYSVPVAPVVHKEQEPPSAPHSYYELMDLNAEPVNNTVRMARVPSQYQLDALSEMFVYDVPQHYTMKKAETCQPVMNNVISADQDHPEIVADDWNTPCYVNSEYVSELLM